MPNIRVKLSEAELVQIIGEHVKKTYNINKTTVHWSGNSPTGAEVYCETDTATRVSFKNLFEE